MFWFNGLCKEVIEDKRIRTTATILVALSGGSGWLLYFFPRLDLMDDARYLTPEAFTFVSAFAFTVGIASMALLA